MTSVADALVTLIDTNWSAGGGVKPTLGSVVDYRNYPNPTDADLILVLLPVRRRLKTVNNNYVDVTYNVRIIVETKTSDARQEIIVVELRHIINNHFISGMTGQRVEMEEDTTDRGRTVFRTQMDCVIEIALEAI